MRVYLGPSRITGTKIQVILTGMKEPSANLKTGDVLQTWIMPVTVDPVTAIRTGSDVSVCGDCKHRPIEAADTEEKPCYVQVARAPLSTWKAHKGQAVEIPRTLAKPIRMGAYGEPTAVPLALWTYLTKLSPSWTGFTHQWKHYKFRGFRRFCMASVDSPAEAHQAHDLGWRTFRVKKTSDPLLPGEISCPASKEAGKRTTCKRCNLCDGARPSDRRKNIAINEH